MAVLKEASDKYRIVQERKEYLIDFLIDHDIYNSQDNRQLYELSLAELERMYITLRCELGKEERVMIND